MPFCLRLGAACGIPSASRCTCTRANFFLNSFAKLTPTLPLTANAEDFRSLLQGTAPDSVYVRFSALSLQVLSGDAKGTVWKHWFECKRLRPVRISQNFAPRCQFFILSRQIYCRVTPGFDAPNYFVNAPKFFKRRANRFHALGQSFAFEAPNFLP